MCRPIDIFIMHSFLADLRDFFLQIIRTTIFLVNISCLASVLWLCIDSVLFNRYGKWLHICSFYDKKNQHCIADTHRPQKIFSRLFSYIGMDIDLLQIQLNFITAGKSFWGTPISPNWRLLSFRIFRMFGSSYLSEFQNEGGSNFSEFWTFYIKNAFLTYIY